MRRLRSRPPRATQERTATSRAQGTVTAALLGEPVTQSHAGGGRIRPWSFSHRIEFASSAQQHMLHQDQRVAADIGLAAAPCTPPDCPPATRPIRSVTCRHTPSLVRRNRRRATAGNRAVQSIGSCKRSGFSCQAAEFACFRRSWARS